MKHVGILLAGLAVMAAAAFALIDLGPFDRTPVQQEALQWQFAELLRTGADPEISQAPSPAYLHGLSPLTRLEPSTARSILRALAAAAAGLLVYGVLRTRLGGWAAVIGGWSAALAPPFVLAAGVFEPEPTAGLLILLAVLFLRSRPGWPAWLAAGGAAGIAALFSPIVGWSALVCFGAAALGASGAVPRWAAAGVFAAGFFTAAAVGSELSGSADALPQVSGITVSMGHHPGASGFDPHRSPGDPRRWWSGADYEAMASRETGLPPSDLMADRYWSRRSIADALKDLPGEAKRTALKTWSTLQADPIPYAASYDFASNQGSGFGVQVLLWLGRLLIPAGLVGWLAARRRLGPAYAAGMAVGLIAALWSYAQPGFSAATAVLLAGGTGALVQVRGIRVWTGVLLSMGVFGIAPLLLSPALRAPAQDHYNLGMAFRAEGRGSAAFREFDKSLALEPDNPHPKLAIAQMLAADDVLEEASAELEAVHREHPSLIEPLSAIGPIYQKRQQWSGMIAAYEALVDLNPFSPEYHNNLGTAYASAGYYDKAEAAFKRALQQDPNYGPARTNLQGMLGAGLALPDVVQEVSLERAAGLVREGRFAEAESVLVRVEHQGSATEVQITSLKGTLAMSRGDYVQAQKYFESIREEAGGSQVFMHNLAVSYASGGKPLEALDIWAGLVRQAPGNQVFTSSLTQVRAALESMASAAKASGRAPEARTIWSALTRHFPQEPAYAESLSTVSKR